MINSLIANTLPFMPKGLVALFAKRYVAGNTPEDAFNFTREINKEGAVGGTIDLLGEFTEDPVKAKETVEMYKLVLDNIEKDKLVLTSLSSLPLLVHSLTWMYVQKKPH